MQVHMIWGQRPDDVAPEVIGAWDEHCIEENPDGFDAAVMRARGRVRTDRMPDNDFVNVAVIIVTMSSPAIEKILNPPNKVMGTIVNPPETTVEEDRQLGEQALRHLRSLTSFAYQAGFHELGYDPVKEVAKLLNLEVPDGEAAVQKCKECRQPVPHHKPDCSERSWGR